MSSTRLAGRKLAFITLKHGGLQGSRGGSTQVLLNHNSLHNEAGEPLDDNGVKIATSSLRRGDWIGKMLAPVRDSIDLHSIRIAVRGKPGYSNTGQWQVQARELPHMLGPSLQTVPLELKDRAFRMRHRHASQIVDPTERDIFFLRNALLICFRNYMNSHNFVEVTTPLLVAGAGGAAARPFETVATEFSDLTLNLRVAPELFLKRLIIGGMQRVYEVGPAFRNEGA